MYEYSISSDGSPYWYSDSDNNNNLFNVRNIQTYPAYESSYKTVGFSMMELIGSIGGVVLLAILIFLCCRCCCRRNEGQVLAPPPEIGTPAPYPQQQFVNVVVPAQTGHLNPMYNTNVPVPYPTGGGYPSAGAPYPNAGAPYPNAGAPYPNPGNPYQSAGAPYPTAMPLHQAAPDAHVLPPTYDQAVGHEKQLPFNPNAPH